MGNSTSNLGLLAKLIQFPRRFTVRTVQISGIIRDTTDFNRIREILPGMGFQSQKFERRLYVQWWEIQSACWFSWSESITIEHLLTFTTHSRCECDIFFYFSLQSNTRTSARCYLLWTNYLSVTEFRHFAYIFLHRKETSLI